MEYDQGVVSVEFMDQLKGVEPLLFILVRRAPSVETNQANQSNGYQFDSTLGHA